MRSTTDLGGSDGGGSGGGGGVGPMSRGRAPGHEGAHAGFEPVQGLIQDGARAGDVHAGEAPTAGAEDRAVVEPQPGLAQDEVVELVRPQSRGRETNWRSWRR